MEKIRYSWDWRVLLLGAGGIVLGFAIAIFSNPTHPDLWQFLIIFAAILLFILVNFTVGTYGLLDKKNGILSRTDYLFYTKRINIRDIKIIYYRPTWLIGGLTRSLYIVDEKENTIEFQNVGWYEPVLARMVNDLRQINASIQLDEHVDALIKKYAHRA